MKEEWRDIEGYEGFYSVSNMGFVKNNKTGKVLSNVKKDSGYMTVNLKKKKILVHRLVLKTFSPIDNPELYEVDHIDSVRDNNRLDNLEWVTRSENQSRRFIRSKEGMSDKVVINGNSPKPLVVTNMESGVMMRFNSLRSFCMFMGFPNGTVYRYMTESKPYKGYFLRRL